MNNPRCYRNLVEEHNEVSGMNNEMILSASSRVRNREIENIDKIKYCNKLMKNCQKNVNDKNQKKCLSHLKKFLISKDNSKMTKFKLRNAIMSKFEEKIMQNQVEYSRKLDGRANPQWNRKNSGKSLKDPSPKKNMKNHTKNHEEHTVLKNLPNFNQKREAKVMSQVFSNDDMCVDENGVSIMSMSFDSGDDTLYGGGLNYAKLDSKIRKGKNQFMKKFMGSTKKKGDIEKDNSKIGSKVNDLGLDAKKVRDGSGDKSGRDKNRETVPSKVMIIDCHKDQQMEKHQS